MVSCHAASLLISKAILYLSLGFPINQECIALFSAGNYWTLLTVRNCGEKTQTPTQSFFLVQNWLLVHVDAFSESVNRFPIAPGLLSGEWVLIHANPQSYDGIPSFFFFFFKFYGPALYCLEMYDLVINRLISVVCFHFWSLKIKIKLRSEI